MVQNGMKTNSKHGHFLKIIAKVQILNPKMHHFKMKAMVTHFKTQKQGTKMNPTFSNDLWALFIFYVNPQRLAKWSRSQARAGNDESHLDLVAVGALCEVSSDGHF